MAARKIYRKMTSTRKELLLENSKGPTPDAWGGLV